ncbi:two-partner secretion domain-containing protein [Massilia alkalitolerans]|uniref:two-partner secretion domain-containing protein n=1 Tax=Massilia alkalitolerans TaxID=286638 RepID=UPI00042495A6|nr:filamentous hemagglutinin N-terminal domain-containing protein [Massilia alkalitolerans]
MRNGLIRLSRAALCVAACFGGVATSAAAPTLPKVVAGQASFSQDGNVFSITNTPGTIINWQSFSVNAGEITRFIQQSSDSAVLNRIVGQDPSRILGALQSNGKVFLINPNGVVFGQGARVDVNGLVASTLDMSDSDFLAGKKNFSAAPNVGNVRNEGAITTPSGGKVFLVAPKVENSGVITAPNGEVVLAAGRSVQLVDAGNPDLSVVVSAPNDQAINLGQVVAQGGRVGIYGALVNQRGVVNADSAVLGQDGRIVLKASRETVLEGGSVTSAQGSGKGGEIQLLGERVSLGGNAQVDASGAAQGGTVLVGGDYQGRNAALPNAQQTSFGKEASIRADATANGEGGKVVLWSDGATLASGSISARGAGAGKGGLVETSGRRLDIDGVRVDAGGGASGGRKGSWLIDPDNIVIADGVSTGDTTYIKASTLTATNADIVLQATRDLKILENLTTPHDVRAEAGNELTVGAALTSTTGSIDLRAKNHINLLAGSQLASPDYIDLKSNRMTLAGMIGGIGSTLPVVSFNSFDKGTSIFVNAAEVNGALTLAPGRLGAFKAYEINIGNSGHTGEIVINNPLTLDGNLVIDSAGSVYLNAPVLLNGATSRLLATLHAPGGLFQVGSAGAIDAGRKIGIGGIGRVVVDGALKSGEIDIHAGSAGMTLTADITSNSRTTLRTSGDIQQANKVIRTPQLLVEANSANLLGNNQIGTLAGSATGSAGGAGLRVHWTGNLRIGSVGEHAGLASQNDITLTGEHLEVDAPVAAPVAIVAEVASVKGTGGLSANVLSIQARGGIGEADRALRTSTNFLLSAKNTASGNAPINIVNDRALVVGNVAQEGVGNGGAISIESTGGLTVGPGSGSLDGVRTGSGDIRLVTHSPLNIQGRVGTDSGNITLLAANDGALTIGPAGRVASASGKVRLTGGQVSYPEGSVVGTLEVVQTKPGTQQPDPVQPDPVQPDPVKPDPVQPDPVKPDPVKPDPVKPDPVQPDPVQPDPVKPDPVQPDPVKPDPVQPDPVKPDPVQPDPTPPQLSVCLANPATAGCSGVIEQATHACVGNPDALGCTQVLPSVDSCRANPGRLGCNVVMQRAFNACLVNKNDPSCAGILPTLAQCEANKALAGCSAVLPSMQQCILGPTQPGCAAILPRLEQCAANPTLQGCEAVLPKPDFCATHPLDARCAVFNPAPSQGGESKKPVAQVQQTTVNLVNTRTPAQEKRPAATPAAGKQDGEGAKPSEQSENGPGPAAGTNTGAKNEKPATKMYCN